MPQEFLNVPDIRTCFQEVSGKAESVNGHILLDATHILLDSGTSLWGNRGGGEKEVGKCKPGGGNGERGVSGRGRDQRGGEVGTEMVGVGRGGTGVVDRL